MITRRDTVIDGVSIFCLRHANIEFHPAFHHRRKERVHQTARLSVVSRVSASRLSLTMAMRPARDHSIAKFSYC